MDEYVHMNTTDINVLSGHFQTCENTTVDIGDFGGKVYATY